MQKAYILFYEKKWVFEDHNIPLRKSVRINNDDPSSVTSSTKVEKQSQKPS